MECWIISCTFCVRSIVTLTRPRPKYENFQIAFSALAENGVFERFFVILKCMHLFKNWRFCTIIMTVKPFTTYLYFRSVGPLFEIGSANLCQKSSASASAEKHFVLFLHNICAILAQNVGHTFIIPISTHSNPKI